MATGDTGISICSDALIMLGARPIASFNEATDEATIANSLYEDVKRTLMTAYPWSFALKKIQLSQLVTAPINEWTYAYQLPADRVGPVRAVFNSDNVGAKSIEEWEIYGDQLFTDEPTIYVDYYGDPGEDKYPHYFVQLLKYWLCWHFAEPVTDQNTKAQYWQQVACGSPGENMRGGMFRMAVNQDAQGQATQTFDDFSLIEVRY